MKSLKMMAAMALMVAATMASAEKKQVSAPTAYVPFSFNVGKKTFPAGEYHIRTEGMSLILTSESGNNVLALSHFVHSVRPAERSLLEFVNNSGTYQLYRVWLAGYNSGRELSLPTPDHKIVQKEAATRVAMGK